MKHVIALFMLAMIGIGMLSIVGEMPTFGDPLNPVFNEVGERYVQEAGEETGSINAVSAIITDYRAFDTLGETAVLFTAIAAVYAALLASGGNNNL